MGAELRRVIAVAFEKQKVFDHYIENELALRHSPRHYLRRQIRVKHGAVVFVAMRKLMFYKFPEWVRDDNWAAEEMSEHNRRKFIVSKELGLGIDMQNDDDTQETEGEEEAQQLQEAAQ